MNTVLARGKILFQLWRTYRQVTLTLYCLSTRRSRSKSPSPHRSSPPSLRSSAFSDFEVFDFEEDSSLEDDGEWTSLGMINSDFSKIQEADWDAVQEYGFDSSSTLDLDDIYSFDPGGKGKAIGLIMENELQNEVSCAPGVL